MKKALSLLFALTLLLAVPLHAQKKGKDEKEQEKHYLETAALSGLKFRSIGPALTSGRISDFAVHPDNRAVYYVATSSGGVWKTDNAGTTYEPIFDGQGSYSIGCITLDPNNPNVVWAGTGENNNQRSVAYGDGIYKSEDGGQSWQHMGLKESEHIGKIIVDPRDSRIVYVAAIGPLWSSGGERGVYKTTDGGANWELILELDEHTGATDLIMDPRDPDVLYAAALQRRRHVFTYVGGGPGSGIYKTTDGGQNWNKANKGLPSGDIGRIGLAISPANPEYLYAMVEAAGNGSGFYRSDNRGASWSKKDSYFTRGNYYSEIVAHPTDPEMVFAMDTYMHYTNDGGKSFQRVGEANKHVDNHCMWIDPEQPDYYLVGCDGGIYESFDAGQTWNYKPNLPVTQFYKVEVDNDLPFYNVYGGTQDNFSLGGPSRTRNSNGITNSDWFVTHGGDGFESAIDPENPDIVYAQSQYGVLVRYDRASGEETGIQPKPAKGEDAFRWNWDAPLMISHHKPTRLYFAANKLFRSDDRGNSWTTLGDDLTRQLDRNTLPVMGRIQSIDAVAKNASTSPYGTIVAFSESPLNEDLLYVGTDDGLIQISEDGGQRWTPIDVNNIKGAPERTYVNALLASQHDENVVYAAFNHHKYGDFKPYVFKSTDKGRTWTSISNNLPERGSAYSLAEDHVDADLLFVGTEFSCFFSPDGGEHWKKLSAGLPTIAVRDIAIQKREHDLVLATFGRGFYILDDYSPLRQISEEQLEADAYIFPIKDGLAYIERDPLGYSGRGFQGASYYMAENPPIGATFTYYIKEGAETLKAKRQKDEKEKIKDGEPIRYPTYEELKAEREEEDAYLLFAIMDAQTKIVIRQLKASVSKGLHRITWDGRMPDVSPIRRPGSPNDDAGVLAAPGDYLVALYQVKGSEQTELAGPQPFKLKSLGGVTLPAEPLEELLNFQAEVQETNRRLDGAATRLRETEERLEAIRHALFLTPNAGEELRTRVLKAGQELQALQAELNGDRIASELDQGAPMGIMDRLGWLTYEMWGSTSAPTQTQRDALAIVKEKAKPILKRMRQLTEVEVKAIEKALDEAGAPYTPQRPIGVGE
jgi:photosystem II stability/assembly factor-like uncharacterized protein